MKKYIFKYETLNGECRCDVVTAFDKQNALNQLNGVKEIYWLKETTVTFFPVHS